MLEMLKDQFVAGLPFLQLVDLQLDELEVGRAVARLPERDALHNHLGRPHAGALFTLGEAASGAAMAGLMGARLMEVRPVASSATIDYVKLARGTVIARGAVLGDHDEILEALDGSGVTTFDVEVSVEDEAGAQVATMRVAWHVSKRRG